MKNSPQKADNPTPVVKRRQVPIRRTYEEYREELREDFFYTCAYCTMSEVEGAAVRFTIDHYQPVGAAPELKCSYTNLMYACDICNTRKGNRHPPPAAQADGLRFYKADQDIFRDHFLGVGIRVEHKTRTGEYTIESLDLNRQNLRRLRDLRRRLHDCEQVMHEGIVALRDFPIDQLPPAVRGRALFAINAVSDASSDMSNAIDSILRDLAKSPMVDPDPDAKTRFEERAAKQKGFEALFPGLWRARRT